MGERTSPNLMCCPWLRFPKSVISMKDVLSNIYDSDYNKSWFCHYLFIYLLLLRYKCLCFLFNLLGWLWLIKLYRFQEYKSIIHHVLCVYHTKSSFLPPPLSLLLHLSTSLPLTITILLSRPMSLFFFFA